MVSHHPSLDLDNICEKIKNNANLSGLSHIKFDTLKKVEINQVEESIYAMIETFKQTPVEISNSLPKELSNRVEKKWQYSLNIERQIRETALARVMSKLDREIMAKELKKHTRKFAPKYRAFNIL